MHCYNNQKKSGLVDFKVSTGKKKADTVSLRAMTKKEITESKI